MNIRCIRTGVVRLKRGDRGVRRYLLDDWSEETLPVNVFLVEHPDGLCLFDTGQTARAAAPGYFPWWQPFFRLSRFELGADDEAAAQLARSGVAPQDVRWVVLSHLHTDHVGGLAAFEEAEIVVPRREWEAASGMAGRIRGYLPQYWPSGVRPRLVDFDGPPLGPFSGTHDVAGDGRLLLVPTPGHTPGHTALLVRDGGRSWLLGGDLAHTAQELDEAAPAVAEFCRTEPAVFLATHDARAPELLAAA
jgi:glyoxylase-like metal-dependent hydrolase (beta-lactamase superfamily II)